MSRAETNTVRIAVRQVVLNGKAFTVFDVHRRTGLNLESIRTEIQRLRLEGLIKNVEPDRGNDSDGSAKKRGAPPSIYQIVEDARKVRALQESVTSFYAQMTVPVSGHLANAREAIEAAMSSGGAIRKDLLVAAQEEMELATMLDGGPAAMETVQAQLDYEWGRLDFLREMYRAAEEKFARARQVFSRTGDKAAASRAEEYVAACTLRMAAPAQYSEIATGLLRSGRVANPFSIAVLDVVVASAPSEIDVTEIYIGRKVSQDRFMELLGFAAEPGFAAI